MLRNVTDERQFNLVPFDRATAAFVKAPTVTVQASGTFSFNHSAFHALGEPPFVEMFFDEEQSVIAFKGVPEETLRTYPIRRQGPKAQVWLVAGKAFLNFFKIPYGEPRRYLIEMINDLAILDLTTGGAPVLTTRRRAHQRDGEDESEAEVADIASPNGMREEPAHSDP